MAVAKLEAADAMLNALADGVAKVLRNANDLYAEAVVLHEAGALSRALFLHQISLEECAKIDMLGGWAVSVLLGVEVQEDKLASAFVSHRAKNYTNAYMIPPGPDDAKARREKRTADSLHAFKHQQRIFHQESNTTKNASLYVSMDGRVFNAPSERITEKMVAEIVQLNEKFLGHAQLKSRMMQTWRRNPSVVRALLEPFLTNAAKLREQLEKGSDDALAEFMDDLFARAEEVGYGAAVRKGMPDSIPNAQPRRFSGWHLRNYWGRLLRKVAALRQ